MHSTAAEHGGAMADGGEARRRLYLGSKGVTAASTRCRRARQSWVRLIAPWWSTVGEFDRRGCGALAGERAERVRAEQRGSAGEWSGERSGFGR